MANAWTMGNIREHMFGVATWVDREKTCDIIYAGDPGRAVTRVGTGWSCCSQNLEAAAADGCDLFISHEGLYPGGHWAPGLDVKDTPWGQRRRRALERSGMACMRLHDTWDNFPGYGIRESWRRFLGLGELIAERPYFRGDRMVPANSLALSRIDPRSLRAFAAELARRCRLFPCFQGATVQGRLDAEISTVATGVGCHIPTLEMLDLGADVLVVTLDRALQNPVRIPLTDMGANVIAVEHGVAEMPGMQDMATYLQEIFPGLQAAFYCNEPPAETITGDDA